MSDELNRLELGGGVVVLMRPFDVLQIWRMAEIATNAALAAGQVGKLWITESIAVAFDAVLAVAEGWEGTDEEFSEERLRTRLMNDMAQVLPIMQQVAEIAGRQLAMAAPVAEADDGAVH